MFNALFTLPAGIFLLLLGLLWQPRPEPDENDESNEDSTTPEAATGGDTASSELSQLSPQATRRFLRKLALRIAILVLGGIALVVGVVSGIGTITDQNALWIFLAVYTVSFLILQRAEPGYRLTVLLILGVVGFMMWRYALYRDYRGEHNWGLVIGGALNWGFYLLVGRRFPPQDRITVITETEEPA